jgi:uncharacterized membrane protein YqjE
VSENKKFLDIFRIKNIVNALIGFIETKVELYKIQFKEEVAKALTIMVLVIILSMVGMLFILFLSHFISRLLNDVFESDYLGFMIVTGFYLVSGLIVYILRRQMKQELLKASDDFEQTLNEDLTSLSEFATQWGGRILLIGGAMLISYLGVRAIIGKKKEEDTLAISDDRTARIEKRNIFIKSLSDKAALVLLALVREYIVNLLSEPQKENE